MMYFERVVRQACADVGWQKLRKGVSEWFWMKLYTGLRDEAALRPGPDLEAVVAAVRDQLLCPVSIIGEITEAEEIVIIDGKGGQRALEPTGWDHFKNQ